MRPSWFGTPLIVAAALAMVACGGRLPSLPDDQQVRKADLLSGEALFGEPVSADELPDKDLLGLDQEMRNFVSDAVSNYYSQNNRLRRLLAAMIDGGLLSLDYRSESTLTARETFYERNGNCLAFTNLFVALAREAGFEASYQQVDIPDIWSGDGELVMLNLHVNVLVRLPVPFARGPLSEHRDYVVDFNEAGFQTFYPQRVVSDEYIEALFYNNLAVSAMRAGKDREAFVYFAKALRIPESVAAVWSNLGVLYARNRLPQYAEGAYHEALRVDPYHNQAISNLVRLYDGLGRSALADDYRDRIRRHRQRNPYYHYFLSEKALEEGHPEEALKSVDRAIRLHKEEHRFHFLRARILAEVGDHAASWASLARAREYATIAEVQDFYDRKLNRRH
jgi:tetratricopeptide (TPR) repeat protein